MGIFSSSNGKSNKKTDNKNNSSNKGSNTILNNKIMSDEEMWEGFTKINQQNQIKEMYIQQQYKLYQDFCLLNRLNLNDYNSFVKFKNGNNNVNNYPPVVIPINNQ